MQYYHVNNLNLNIVKLRPETGCLKGKKKENSW